MKIDLEQTRRGREEEVGWRGEEMGWLRTRASGSAAAAAAAAVAGAGCRTAPVVWNLCRSCDHSGGGGAKQTLTTHRLGKDADEVTKNAE